MFRKRTLFFILLWTLITEGFPIAARAASYDYADKESRVEFTLKHLGVITVSGHFKTFSGAFEFDPEHIQNTRVTLAIQTASVDSANAIRDAQLRSKNFFWSEEHPEIKFVSREIRNIQRGRFDIYGNLTIRGRTNPVVFETELLTAAGDVTGEGRISFHTHTFINRKDFQLGTENWFDPIMFVTGETLKISLEVVGIPHTTEP